MKPDLRGKLVALRKLVVGVLAAIGLVVVLAQSLNEGLGLHRHDAVLEQISPNGEYVARLIKSEQLFDTELLVTLGRRDNNAATRTVVTYETTSKVAPVLRWRDLYTLVVFGECVPPSQIKPAYYDDSTDVMKRIVVEWAPKDPNCRFRRGPYPWAGE